MSNQTDFQIQQTRQFYQWRKHYLMTRIAPAVIGLYAFGVAVLAIANVGVFG